MSNDIDIDKAYVSPYDKFLFGFDANHEMTASQRKEIEQHQHIASMRDNKDYQETTTEIWTEF